MEWRRRGSGASLFILVQIQAGPPRFTLTGYAWRSHAGPAGKAGPAKFECNESEDGLAAGAPQSEARP